MYTANVVELSMMFTFRYRVARALELLWGFPALVAMRSRASDIWKVELSEGV